MIRPLFAALAAALLLATGCKSATTSAAPASHHPRVLVSDPGMMHILSNLSGCTATATDGGVTFTLNSNGQPVIPGTTTPATITVTHWTAAPLRQFDRALRCALPAAIYPSAQQCVAKLTPPASQSAAAAYLKQVAACGAGAPQ